MDIFISATTFAKEDKAPLKILKKNSIGYVLNSSGRRLTEGEIADILKNGKYSGLIAGTEPLTRQVLEDASKTLKVVSRLGAGLDNIDLGAARSLKIRVYNTPDLLTDSVAELAIALILCSLRQITLHDRYIRNGLWKKEMGVLFKDKILGIIGFGRIGRRVAQLSKAFGAKVIYYDIRPIKHKIFTKAPLNRLLKNSDIISIHCSSKDMLITKKEMANMKKDAVLINTSRGSVIDEDALYKALKSKRIAFAALDVYNHEPYCGRLARLDNIILTPHIGSYAKESRAEMEREATENLIKGFRKAGLL